MIFFQIAIMYTIPILRVCIYRIIDSNPAK